MKKKQRSSNSFCKNKLDRGLVACFHLVDSKKFGTFCASPATFYRVMLYGLFAGKNNRFPCLDILGYLKNTHKNPKFGRVRQVPIRELGWEFPGWDLSHFVKFGIFVGIH